ncbi:nitroreductase/quinone reductase family protein [Streptomyces sp. NPDC087420]|uniref:nitroreductase/quinone reductase family protein n=1 Tax=Streptomyces sp. NPDC087420 TaxID=3365785 RepID=UPI003834DE85
MSDPNAPVIDEFRAHHGVLGGHFEGKHLLLLHTVGRKSGNERVTPLVYATHHGSLLICGTLGGAPKDPQWVANTAAADEVTIEIGERTLRARRTVVRPSDPEWPELYGVWADYWPDAHEYQKKTSRRFPIVSLDPIHD